MTREHRAMIAPAQLSASGRRVLRLPQDQMRDPGQSFVLDIADLYRDTLTIPCAFRSAKRAAEQPEELISPVFATAKMVIAMNIQAGNQGAARATTSTSGALASANSCHGTTEAALIDTPM